MKNGPNANLDDALDALAGELAPDTTLAEAVRRLEALGWSVDDNLRRELGDWLWIERSLRAAAPRPPVDFVERVLAAPMAPTVEPTSARTWTYRLVGALAACVAIAVTATILVRPPADRTLAESQDKQAKPVASETDFPGDRLFAQVQEIAPRLRAPQAPSLALASAPSLDAKPIRDALAAPAGSVVEVGRRLPGRIQPIGTQVRDAFAFLSELQPGAKTNL